MDRSLLLHPECRDVLFGSNCTPRKNSTSLLDIAMLLGKIVRALSQARDVGKERNEPQMPGGASGAQVYFVPNPHPRIRPCNPQYSHGADSSISTPIPQVSGLARWRWP
jgi:hypothetical protein